MMKKYLAIISMLLLFSCGNEEEVIPPGIMSQEEMTLLLVDMELAQAQAKYMIANENTSLKDNMYFFEQVFNKHQISQEEFNNNLEYYCTKPLVMQDMYIEVIEILSEKEANNKKQ